MTVPRDPFWEELLRKLRASQQGNVTLGPTEAVGYYASPALAREVDPIQAGLRLGQAQDNTAAMQRSQAAMQEGRGLLPTAGHLFADAGASVFLPGADDPKEMARLRLQRLLGRPGDENPTALQGQAAGLIGWPAVPRANRPLIPEEQETARRLRAVIADPNVQGAQSRLDAFTEAGGNPNAPLLPGVLQETTRAHAGDPGLTAGDVFGASAAGGAVGANLGLNTLIPNVGNLEAGMTAKQIGAALLKAGVVEGGTGGLMVYSAALAQGATPQEALREALPQAGIQAGLGMGFRGLHGAPALTEAGAALPEQLRQGTREARQFIDEALFGPPMGRPLQPMHEYQLRQEMGLGIPDRLRRAVDEQEARLDAEEAGTATPEPELAGVGADLRDPQQFHDHFFEAPDQLPRESILGLNERGMVGTFGLRSRLPKSIQAAKLEKAPAQTWVSKLRGAGNNASEFDWVVGEVLRRDPKRVWTRQQLLDLAEGKGIKLEERVLGESPTGTKPTRWVHEGEDSGLAVDERNTPVGRWEVERDEDGNIEQVVAQVAGGRRESFSTPEEAQRFIESEHGSAMGYGGEPRHSGYQLPGGTNYREVVVRLDNPGHDEFRVENHWDDPNVLLHLRLNDRVGPNGEKVLFVEEVQSDWMQKGRKEGFRASTERQEQIRERIRQIEAEVEASGRDASPDAQAEYIRLTNELEPHRVRSDAVPDAPGMFKDTPQWTLLGLKRALDEAVAGGYDRMAWTTGAQQAERYDLSKQISRIGYNPATGKLRAWDLDGAEVVNRPTTPQELPEVIGKEAAQRLLDTQPENPNGAYRELSGLDLQVGGEGMHGYYDQILPDALRAYGKKLGVRLEVEPAQFGEGPKEYSVFQDDAESPWRVYDTMEEAEQFVQERVDHAAIPREDLRIVEGFRDPAPSGNLSIRITPELRTKIQGGQELGQGAPRILAGTAGGIGGAAYGATQGDTPEERLRNAALYGLGGLTAGVGVGKFAENAPLARLFGGIEEGFPSVPRGEVRGLLDELGAVGYHGTNTGPFENFDRMRGPGARQGIASLDQIGPWFASDAVTAGKFGERVAMAEVGVHNPLVVNSLDELEEAWRASGAEGAGSQFPKGDPEKFRSWLQDQGYDGLHIPDASVVDPGVAAPGTSYTAALDNTQVQGLRWPSIGNERGAVGRDRLGAKLRVEKGRPRDVGEAAIQEFGETQFPSEAGYLLSDGRWVDFSEGSGSRITDHRSIERIFTGADPARDSRFANIQRMMDEGHARIHISNGSVNVDLSQPLTANQVRQLRSAMLENGRRNEVSLDFTVDGETVASVFRNNVGASELQGMLDELYEKAGPE